MGKALEDIVEEFSSDTLADDEEFQDQYRADLSINAQDISTEFIKQPGLISGYAGIYEAASDAYRRMKSDFEIFEAETRSRLREELPTQGRKVTEGSIADALLLDSEYKARRKALFEIEHEVETVKICFESIREKGRVLLSLGTIRRAELESGIWLNQSKKV